LSHARRISALACGALILIAAPKARPAIQSAPVTHEWIATPGDSTVSPLLEVLGSSGNLRALIGTSVSLAQSLVLQPLLSGVPLGAPGVHSLGLPAPDGDPLVVVTLEPFEAMQGARLDAYRVGRWPTHGLAARNPSYAHPQGFISVTPANEYTQVSKRFRLRDFLTHDQQNVWPKVLVLRVPLLDKLELIGDELERRGLPSSLHIMSGFRTPQYNAQGVGPKGGRARESRHMYGDAADVIVDGNEDGVMDDLDGDGRVTIGDARVLLAVAEGVELEHPDLVGGLSAYRANSAHGPFVHIDARGVRARW
jgi:peptidase M15-like protein